MKISLGIHGFERQVRSAAARPKATTNKNDQAGMRTGETKQVKSDESSQKGVIQNIQAGHYKGVADLRLRTIFQADLKRIQEENDSALVNQAAADLVSAISAEFNSLAGTQFSDHRFAAADDALAKFNAEVADVVALSPDSQVALSDLRSVVDAFLSSFAQKVTAGGGELGPPIDAEPFIADGSQIDPGINPDELLEVADVSDSTIAFEGEADQLTELLNNLRGIAEEIFSNLQTSLMESGLPEPTRPNNRGMAYEKFLAIYRANSVNDSVVPEPNQIDVPTENSASDNTFV